MVSSALPGCGLAFRSRFCLSMQKCGKHTSLRGSSWSVSVSTTTRRPSVANVLGPLRLEWVAVGRLLALKLLAIRQEALG